MVSHKHKFIFLHIPKCAGTSIGETLNSYFDEYWNYSGFKICLLYTSPSPRDGLLSRMPSSA